MSKLIIVESPAKAKTIEKYLGKDYIVKASMGHLRDLPKKNMGIDIENNFEPMYMPIDGKDKTINELKKASKDSELVYLATDPDREGEAISWHLKELLDLDDNKSKRVTFNEITKTAVRYAVDNPRDIDKDLVDSQQARRMLDRIVGYKLSPFLWKKVRRGLSAGRVQSVATRLVVEREREIRAFVAKEYWSIDAILNADGNELSAYFHGNTKGKLELTTKEQTDEIINIVKDSDFSVGNIKKGKRKKSPAPPFTTSTLQQEASRKLNMSPKKTMSVAQQLYEGIDIEGQGLTGLITYMRTDSVRISEDAVVAARDYIIKTYGKDYYPAKPKVYKSKGKAQDAHEAIRPASMDLSPDYIKSSLSNDQFRLYKLIWLRFLSCQMADAILDTVSADILSSNYVFRAAGHVVQFTGFTAIYEESSDDEGDEKQSGKALFSLKSDSVLKLKQAKANQHFTQPPGRFTEASLIKAMEEKGIGRPSTYAPTISTITDRDYVVKEQKTLKPTNLGEAVTDLMIDKFNDIVDIKFTANMEDMLDEIEDGKASYVDVLSKFYVNFDEGLKNAEKSLDNQKIKVADEVSDVECELCHAMMVIKSSKFGKFLACPSYPDCKNTKPIVEDAGVSCPICSAKVLKKKSKRGYAYLGCEKNPECEFMTWDKPTKIKCPKCEGDIFKHYDRESKVYSNVCLKPECLYEQKIEKKSKKSEK